VIEKSKSVIVSHSKTLVAYGLYGFARAKPKSVIEKSKSVIVGLKSVIVGLKSVIVRLKSVIVCVISNCYYNENNPSKLIKLLKLKTTFHL
jgi:hypothetical protein